MSKTVAREKCVLFVKFRHSVTSVNVHVTEHFHDSADEDVHEGSGVELDFVLSIVGPLIGILPQCLKEHLRDIGLFNEVAQTRFILRVE